MIHIWVGNDCGVLAHTFSRVVLYLLSLPLLYISIILHDSFLLPFEFSCLLLVVSSKISEVTTRMTALAIALLGGLERVGLEVDKTRNSNTAVLSCTARDALIGNCGTAHHAWTGNCLFSGTVGVSDFSSQCFRTQAVSYSSDGSSSGVCGLRPLGPLILIRRLGVLLLCQLSAGPISWKR